MCTSYLVKWTEKMKVFIIYDNGPYYWRLCRYVMIQYQPSLLSLFSKFYLYNLVFQSSKPFILLVTMLIAKKCIIYISVLCNTCHCVALCGCSVFRQTCGSDYQRKSQKMVTPRQITVWEVIPHCIHILLKYLYHK
jgi:hypothetical protein